VQSLKQDVESGIIGNVDYIETEFVTQGYHENVRLYKDQGGGAMYDLGCYCTTMILSLCDSKPESVKAVAEYSEGGVDLLTSAIIRFENGVRAAFHVGMILGKDTDDRNDALYIHGDKGSIRSAVEYNQEGELSYRIYTREGIIERKATAPQNYSLEITQLGRCILGGETQHVTPEFSVKNAELMDAVFAQM
jgi:predicted dehydrogenase